MARFCIGTFRAGPDGHGRCGSAPARRAATRRAGRQAVFRRATLRGAASAVSSTAAAPFFARCGLEPARRSAAAAGGVRLGGLRLRLGGRLDLPVALRGPGGVDAGLEHRHEVDELAAGRRRLGLGDLASLDLGLDDLLEGGPVLVAVLGRVERAGHRRDELLGHLPLGGLDLDLLDRDVELVGRPDLVRPVERLEDHDVAVRLQRGERLAVLDHDLADRGEPLLGEDLAEQRVGLPADGLGLDVVGLLEEPRRLVLGRRRRHELLDLDRADGLERDAGQVLVGDDDVLVLGVLVALDRVAARDDLVVVRAVDLHLDPVQAALVEHVERDPPRLGREVEPHGDRHQAELDRPPPHRSRHDRFRAPPRPAAAGATSRRARPVDREGECTPSTQDDPRCTSGSGRCERATHGRHVGRGRPRRGAGLAGGAVRRAGAGRRCVPR